MVAVDTQRSARVKYEPIVSNEPDYRRLPVAGLNIAHAYQREPNPQFNKWVDETVAIFDPDLLGVLMVAEDDGQFYVWDGQGRLEVLKRIGITHAWCQVSNANQQRQAELFGQQVNRRNLTWTDRHKALVVEGNQSALDIDLIAETYGYSVGSGQNRIRAVGALYWIYNRGGSELLGDVLRTISTCWSDAESGISDRAMKGLGFFYNAFPADVVDREEALKVFATVSPSQILGEAAKNMQTSTKSTNSAAEFARLLMKAFNKRMGRRLHSKPIAKANDLRATRWQRAAEQA